MKKSISLLIVTIIILTSIPFITVSADEGALTEDDVYALVNSAWNCFTLVQESVVQQADGIPFLVNDSIECKWKEQNLFYFESDPNGDAYKNELMKSASYVTVTDSRFDTMDKCYSYVEQWFTKDLAKNIVEVHALNSYRFGQKIPCFRLSDGGKKMNIETKVYEDCESGTVLAAYLWRPADSVFYLKSIDGFTVNGDSAVVNVTYQTKELLDKDSALQEGVLSQNSHFNLDYTFLDYYIVNKQGTITLKKSADGWKVSGGTFFDAVRFEESMLTVGLKVAAGIISVEEAYGVVNPNTGDEAAILVALVALSGLAVACVPAVKRRKIR